MPHTKKLVIIGDKLLDARRIADALAPQLATDWEVIELTYGPDDLAALDSELGKMEAAGADAVAAPAELLEAARGADVILTHMCPINTAVLEAAERVQLIGVLRGGTENVLTELASARGIPVFNTLGRTSEAVSDYALGLMLAETRNIARSHAKVQAGVWEKHYANTGNIPEMQDLTVGLVGFGEIGRLVHQKLAGFRSSVRVYDPYVDPAQLPAGCTHVTDLGELLRTSDIVSLHARHDIGAPPILTRELLAQLRPTSYLINTARAGIVDMQALTEALAAGRIAGAALDVFEVEPLPADSPLRTLPNVTLTSHIAFDTNGFYEKSPVLWLAGLRAYATDGTRRSFVNAAAVAGEGITALGL